MASDADILKVGFAEDPYERLRSVALKWKSIHRVACGWGMPRYDAMRLERLAHKALSQYAIGNEIFRVSTDIAISTINRLIVEQAILSIPLPPREVRKRAARQDKKTFSLRLPEDLRIESERLAKEESRTLTSLITYLLTREVSVRRPAKQQSREPVTAGSR